MIGIEFVADRASRAPVPELLTKIELAAFARGLLLLSCGRSTLRLAPPLTIDAQDVDTGLAIIDDVLREVT